MLPFQADADQRVGVAVDRHVAALRSSMLPGVLILGLILFGMVVGAVAQLILGKKAGASTGRSRWSRDSSGPSSAAC